MRSAGEGFQWGLQLARHAWIVLLHQDVYLPQGWDGQFLQQLQAAQQRHPSLAVAGVYGVCSDGRHAGHVLDRDRWLGGPFAQAEPVRSLDELLLAVRAESGLRPDPALGWHLYGTDLCLQAADRGNPAVVVDAPCEHRSTLPRSLPQTASPRDDGLAAQIQAFNASAQVLARRWPHAMPVVTAVTTIDHGRVLEADPR